MAIIPKTKYPGKTIGDDPNYPQGKARNRSTPYDADGFPFEEAWVNDLLGFQQALLDAAGITPSGDPDKVGASQYLGALGLVTKSDDGELIYVDATGAPAPKQRSKRVLPMHAVPGMDSTGAPDWYFHLDILSSADYSWWSRASQGSLVIDLRRHVPYGAIITNVSFRVVPGAEREGLDRMHVGVSFDGGVTNYRVWDDGTTSLQTLNANDDLAWQDIEVTMDDLIAFVVSGSDGESVVDRYLDLTIEYLEPGPRFF